MYGRVSAPEALLEPEIEIEGILVALNWRADGSVTALGLNLPGERELRIVCSQRRCVRLARHLRKRVRMSGWIDGEEGVFRPSQRRVVPTSPGSRDTAGGKP